MSDIELKTFPKNKFEALTLIYLENQDLSNKTPEEIVTLYLDTEFKIREKFREIRNQVSAYRSFQAGFLSINTV